MQRNKKVVLAPAAAVANTVCLSQTPGGAGNLTINGGSASGGVATLDVARRVAIAGTGNEAGKTFTITGTDRAGNLISEALAGPNNSTVYTTKDFKTVTQIAVSAGTAAAITAGTNGVLSSGWLVLDRYNFGGIAFGITTTGVVNYTVEHTDDDPFQMPAVAGSAGAADIYLNPFPHPTVTGQVGSAHGTYSDPVSAVRITINSYTAGATVTGFFNPGSP
jgi:VCBS repeat-containing protein